MPRRPTLAETLALAGLALVWPRGWMGAAVLLVGAGLVALERVLLAKGDWEDGELGALALAQANFDRRLASIEENAAKTHDLLTTVNNRTRPQHGPR